MSGHAVTTQIASDLKDGQYQIFADGGVLFAAGQAAFEPNGVPRCWSWQGNATTTAFSRRAVFEFNLNTTGPIRIESAYLNLTGLVISGSPSFNVYMVDSPTPSSFGGTQFPGPPADNPDVRSPVLVSYSDHVLLTATPFTPSLGDFSVPLRPGSMFKVTHDPNWNGSVYLVLVQDGEWDGFARSPFVSNPTADHKSRFGGYPGAYQVGPVASLTVEYEVIADAPPYSDCDTKVANNALIVLGERMISDLNESSKTAKLARDSFDSIRQGILRMYDWNFAMNRVVLSPDTSAATSQFTYSYTLPYDCLRVVNVASVNGRPWRVEGGKIVTDIGPQLALQYVRDVSDCYEMDPLFKDLWAALLAERLAEPITGSPAKLGAARERVRALRDEARRADVVESPPGEVRATEWSLHRRGY